MDPTTNQLIQCKCLVVDVDVNTSLESSQSMANDVTSIITARVCRSRNQTPLSRQKATPQTKSKKLHAIVESQKSTDTEDSDGEPLLVTDVFKVHKISESMWLSTISVIEN